MLKLSVCMDNLDDTLKKISGCGIYAFRSTKLESNTYLYIGKSTDLKGRMSDHKKWIQELITKYDMDLIDVYHIPLDRIDNVEKQTIEYHRPHFNRSNKPDAMVELKLKIPKFLATKFLELKFNFDTSRNPHMIEQEGIEYILKKYSKAA